MPISFTRRGRYRLTRDGVEISRHNVELEAVESGFSDAEINGAGRYRIYPPDYVEFDVPVITITRNPRTPGTPPPPDVTPPLAPGSPSAVTQSDTVIRLSWSASLGAVSYNIYLATVTGGPYSLHATTAALTYDVSSLTPETQYFFKITALDSFLNETALGDCTEVSDTTDAGAGGGGSDDPGNPLFFDDFDYVLATDTAYATKLAAVQAAGWGGLKDTTGGGSGALGTFSTTTTIPGYSGTMPGLSGTGRVARWAMLPVAGQNQTDAYLIVGTPGAVGAPDPVVPGDVWFQFWMYVNNSGTEQSHFAARNKIIYPSDDGTTSGGGGEGQWILNIRPSNQAGVIQPYGPNCNIVLHVDAGWGGGDGTITSNAPEGVDRLGDNLINYPQVANGWYLVKLHLKTDTDNGVYEKWLRTLGGEWVKTAEWISGTTSGFTWYPHTALRAGQNLFKFPTTFGTANFSDTTDYQVWFYIADFAMAEAEADLPTYGSY